jgi:hypothetical protein
MLKNKLIILFSYCIILNYFGDALGSNLQLFAPLLWLGFGSLFQQFIAVLILICYFYLAFSSFLYPYNNRKLGIYMAISVFCMSLIPTIIQINKNPTNTALKFFITLVIFILTTIYVLKISQKNPVQI